MAKIIKPIKSIVYSQGLAEKVAQKIAESVSSLEKHVDNYENYVTNLKNESLKKASKQYGCSVEDVPAERERRRIARRKYLGLSD